LIKLDDYTSAALDHLVEEGVTAAVLEYVRDAVEAHSAKTIEPVRINLSEIQDETR
jgi:hypothetical protein